MNNSILKLVLLTLLTFSCYDKDVDQTPSEGTDFGDPSSYSYKLLFIGNSLTASNNLPNLVKERAFMAGLDIITDAVTFGNYGLEDHWNDGNIQNMIETNNYDFVIIQQGPSSQAYGRSSLIEFGGYIKQVCTANNAELAYYMVWPSLQYYHTFPGVIQNYTDAANINNARLCPVGLHWKNYFDQTNDFSYYGPDGFHPSLEGSKVAAEVILQSLNIL